MTTLYMKPVILQVSDTLSEVILCLFLKITDSVKKKKCVKHLPTSFWDTEVFR